MAKATAEYSATVGFEAKLWLAEDKLHNRIEGGERGTLRMDCQ